jgi:hypothetical protein
VRRPYGSGWHNATGLSLAMLHNVAQWWDGLTGGVGGTVPGRDSQAHRGVDSSLTCAPTHVSVFNAHVGGAGMEAASP